MSEWLLTDEEIKEAYWKYGTVAKTPEARAKQVAKAQAKKLVEWLEKSLKHTYCADKKDGYEQYFIGVKDWQALRKEVGLEVKDEGDN